MVYFSGQGSTRANGLYPRLSEPQAHGALLCRYAAMAVGLELTLHETEEALRLSGLGYDNSDDTDYAYMYMLSAFHGCPIDECNTVLEKLNVKPLGTKSKK